MRFSTNRAVVIEAYGGPTTMALASLDTVLLKRSEVRISVLAAAVNHTDVKIRQGAWPLRPGASFPYVPGVECIGTVVDVGTDVSTVEVGTPVITMMQGLGGVRAERAGTYAEYVTVDQNAVAPLPPDVDALAMAALGLPAVTALLGLERAGPLKGKRVLVTGAAGNVGRMALSLGTLMGATICAVVRDPQNTPELRKLGAAAVFVANNEDDAGLPRAAFDAVLDTVAGKGFGALVDSVADNGTLCMVGAVAGGDVAFDAWQLIRPITLTGYSTEALTGDDLRASIRTLGDWLSTGALAAPPYRLMPLRSAAGAHRLVEAGGAGRILLTP